MWFGYSLWTHASARLANRSAALMSNMAGLAVFCAMPIPLAVRSKDTVHMKYFIHGYFRRIAANAATFELVYPLLSTLPEARTAGLKSW